MTPTRFTVLVAIVLLTGLCVAAQRAAVAEPATKVEGATIEDGVSVLFSPDGGCTDAIVQAIRSARESIHVQAYRLTSVPIVKALVDAHGRGVKLSIVLDKSQQSDKYSDATYFHNNGISVLIDHKHAIAHNKIIVIDRRLVITGSFNFSKAAEESNAENLLIIEDKPKLTEAYLKNFSEHERHAEPYRKPAGVVERPKRRD
jgi:phosphatidylserine/phosphatidylglycerophosphate/cardiolipin synthase-like enzyme